MRRYLTSIAVASLVLGSIGGKPPVKPPTEGDSFGFGTSLESITTVVADVSGDRAGVSDDSLDSAIVVGSLGGKDKPSFEGAPLGSLREDLII